jgi:hypothetical protein
VNFVGEIRENSEEKRCSGEEGAAILASRPTHPAIRPDPNLPADTRLWAALQRLGGGTWGGCVYDVDQILRVIAAGEAALAPKTCEN